jgi:hypothetical protein
VKLILTIDVFNENASFMPSGSLFEEMFGKFNLDIHSCEDLIKASKVIKDENFARCVFRGQHR